MVVVSVKIVALALVVAVVLVISGILLLLHQLSDSETSGVLTETIEIHEYDLSSCEYICGGSGTEEDPYVIDKLSVLVTESVSEVNPRGVVLWSVDSHLLIRNSTFDLDASLLSESGREGCGLFMSNSHNATVESCRFKNLGCGIAVEGRSTTNIKNCSFKNCLAGVAFDGAYPPLEKSVLSENHFSSCERGISVDGHDFDWEIDIVNNTFSSCYIGIQGYEAGLLSIELNRIMYSDYAGIRLISPSLVRIESNAIHGSQGNGIAVSDGRHVAIAHNSIEGAGVGIYITQSQMIQVEFNEIAKDLSGGWDMNVGIFVDRCIGTNVTENQLMFTEIGILVSVIPDEDDTVVLLDNEFSSCRVEILYY